jgi:hypothetical protein
LKISPLEATVEHVEDIWEKLNSRGIFDVFDGWMIKYKRSISAGNFLLSK